MSLRHLLPKDMASFRSSKVVPVSPVDSLNNTLTRNTTLHRLVLQKPIQSHLQLDQWYRVNVDIVTEMGILLAPHKLEDEFQHGIRLTCSIYHHRPIQQDHDQDPISLEIEPLMKDIWDADTVVIAPWPGFAPRSCHGGFKYRLPIAAMSSSYPNTSLSSLLSKPCYLIIQSTSHADAILPVVVGPVHFEQSLPSSSPTVGVVSFDHDWGNGYQIADCINCKSTVIDHREGPMHQIHRKIVVNHGCHLLIKERGSCGTAGKLWDSALLMTSLFVNAVYKQPDRFVNHRILDLSAGTGYTGIYIAKLYQNHPQPPTVFLTDIKESLPLLYENQAINQVDVQIFPLMWGKKKEARRVTSSTTKVIKFKSLHITKTTHCPLDIVIASDVLYNAKDMVNLVQTFLDLSTYGKTVIYFGYKNRGLREEELIRFFQLCQVHFDVDLIKPTTQSSILDSLSLPSQSIPYHLHIPFLIQSGVCIYTMTRKKK